MDPAGRYAKVTVTLTTGPAEIAVSSGKGGRAPLLFAGTPLALRKAMVTRSLSTHPRRQRSRRLERGITRFELGLAVGALTLTLTGALYALNKSRSDGRVESSQRAAGQILNAANDYVTETGAGCPTVSSLKHDKFLDRAAPTSDAWGARFRIVCTEGELIVHSAGADAKNSGDDVRVVRSRS